MTTRRRSSRASQACRARAMAESAWMLRSWNSSSTIVRKPDSSGSCCSRAVRIPSVTTSSFVAPVNFRSNRTCQPTSLSERPALLRRDARGDAARRDTPRLQQDDRAVGRERRRHPRRLAGTGRGSDHGRTALADVCEDGWNR